MAQKSKPVASKEKHSVHHRHDEITAVEDEIEEIEIPQKKTFYDKVTQVMEKFASTRMGQMIVERIDRVLKVVEDTAKWSLPQDDKSIQLERPLPWIFFLSLIVWLRVLRIGLSVASFMVGSQRVTPESMVYYIQIKRRRLRAIRVNGLKSIRSREIESTVMYSGSSGKKVTFVGKLRTLLGSAICKPGQHRDVPSRRVFVQDGKAESAKDQAERSSKRPRDDDSVDLNLTVDEMLDKYANEDSDADSDYVPNDDEDADSISTSCDGSSSEDTEKENDEQIDDNPKKLEKSAKSKNDNKPWDGNDVEIKENGGTKKPTMPKPICQIKIEPLSDGDSGNEHLKKHKEGANTNGLDESGKPIASGIATEAAPIQPKISMNTTQNTSAPLAVSEVDEDKHKSTSGPKPAIKISFSTTAATAGENDSGNEHPQTPKATANTNGFNAAGKSAVSGAETEAASTKPQLLDTPKTTFNQLAAPVMQEDEQKSTPGHKTAATLKPVISTTATADTTALPNDIPLEKCYKTVTTQTSIEIDWSITLKTEISQIKPQPKLEKLNCSIPLTPATSTEDIFYSPIGSPQDFHSIFHPAPIVKTSSVDAHSTPKEEDNHNEHSSTETSESVPANQSKYLHNLTNNKQNFYHHNGKYRNKNRR